MPLNPGEIESITDIFEEEINALIRDLGKDCLVVFKDTITPGDNPAFDPVYGDSKIPEYKFTPELSNIVKTQNTIVVRMLITHNPSDFISFVGKIYEPSDIIRVKTHVSYAPELRRCDYIIPDINRRDIFGHKYRLIRDCVPRGLVRNSYLLAYFQRVD